MAETEAPPNQNRKKIQRVGKATAAGRGPRAGKNRRRRRWARATCEQGQARPPPSDTAHTQAYGEKEREGAVGALRLLDAVPVKEQIDGTRKKIAKGKDSIKIDMTKWVTFILNTMPKPLISILLYLLQLSWQ
jgi:hypothetical protein